MGEKLIDTYGPFLKATQHCDACDWTGPGSEMVSGEIFGTGAEKHCPRCGEYWGFVGFPLVVREES